MDTCTAKQEELDKNSDASDNNDDSDLSNKESDDEIIEENKKSRSQKKPKVSRVIQLSNMAVGSGTDLVILLSSFININVHARCDQ